MICFTTFELKPKNMVHLCFLQTLYKIDIDTIYLNKVKRRFEGSEKEYDYIFQL